MSMLQEIKLKLKAFDHRILDKAVEEIVRVVDRTGARIKGPIPLPRHIEKFTVNRSTHKHKKSREQFEMRNHCRMLVIESSPQIIDALMKLDLAAGVEVEIKINGVE